MAQLNPVTYDPGGEFMPRLDPGDKICQRPSYHIAQERVQNHERITSTAVMYARQVPAAAYHNHVIPALIHMGDMRVKGRSVMQTSNL
jgi:hypothetical protein